MRLRAMFRFLTTSIFLLLCCLPTLAESSPVAKSTEITFVLPADEAGKTPFLSPELKSSIEFALKHQLQEMTLSAKALTWTKEGELKLTLPPLGEAVRAETINTLSQKKHLRYGYLTLHHVHPKNAELVARMAKDPKVLPPSGYQLVNLIETDEDDKPTNEKLWVRKLPILSSNDIIHAQELYGPHEGKTSVELNKEGAKKMFQATKALKHGFDRIAIILDGKVMSAPVVQDTLGSRFEISGMKDASEAQKLARGLLNPLNKPLKIKSINPPLAK